MKSFGIEMAQDAEIRNINVDHGTEFPKAGTESPARLFFRTDHNVLYIRNGDNNAWLRTNSNADSISSIQNNIATNGTFIHNDGSSVQLLTTISLNSEDLPFDDSSLPGISADNVRDAILEIQSESFQRWQLHQQSQDRIQHSGNFSKLENEVNANTSDITTNTSDISTLNEKISTIETNNKIIFETEFPKAGTELPAQLFFRTDHNVLYIRNGDNNAWLRTDSNADSISSIQNNIATNGTFIHNDGSSVQLLTTISLNSEDLPFDDSSLPGISADNVRDAILEIQSKSSGNFSKLENEVNANTANISTNTSGITTNASNISTNTSDISTNASDILTNTSGITTNTSGITTNTSGITTNTSGITTNTSDILTNTSDILTNTSNITTNASNILTNTSNITTNASDILTNTSNISTNASDILTNTSNITTLDKKISTIETTISLNSEDLPFDDSSSPGILADNVRDAIIEVQSKSSGNFSKLENEVNANTANITTNTSNISTNTSGITTNTSDITILDEKISAIKTTINLNSEDLPFDDSSSPGILADNVRDAILEVQNESSENFSKLENKVNANTANITTNTSGISTNTSDISTNTSDISTNASDILTNTSGITTNTSGITTNTSNITTNASNILTNTSNITTNASGITTNASNISTNTSNITILDKKISAIKTNKKTISGTAYSVIADDKNKMLVCTNTSPLTITIPDGVFTHNDNDVVEFQIIQDGTGKVTIAGDGSQIINISNKSIPIIHGQYNAITVALYDVDTWIIHGDLASKIPFIFKVETTGADETFTLPCGDLDVYNVDIDWGDGSNNNITSYDDPNLIHNYATSGSHTIKIHGKLPWINFNNTGDKDKLISINAWGDIGLISLKNAFSGCTNLVNVAPGNILTTGDTNNVTNFNNAWADCVRLTSFPLIDTSSGTNFEKAWQNCRTITTFPLIDTSSGTDFNNAWADCVRLTSFPLIDTSSGTNFEKAWQNCRTITTFPLIDTSSGTDFNNAWYNCNGLTTFPLIDTSSGTNFNSTWQYCNGLTTFPLIDTSSGTDFSDTWNDCTHLDFDASGFDISKATTMENIFKGTSFSNTNYDLLLTSWSAKTVQPNVSFHAGSAKYSLPVKRLILTDPPNNWSISDGGVA